MKKLFTTLCMAMLCANLYAQPTLVRDSIRIPATFNISTLSAFNPLVLLSGSANATWDVSSATATALGTGSLLDISATPWGSTYPAANFAIKFTVSSNDVYSLFNLTNSVMEEVGNNVSTGGGVPFIDYRTAVVFPFTYLQSNTDSYQKQGQGVKSVTNIYSGYGTFISPTHTYTNVIRIYTFDDGDTAVNFWRTNPSAPLFTANTNGFMLWEAAPANITEVQSASQLNITPNPATNELTVVSAQPATRVEVFNLQGRLQLVSAEPLVNIAGLTAGVYFIKVYTRQGVSTQKFVKQ